MNNPELVEKILEAINKLGEKIDTLIEIERDGISQIEKIKNE